MHQIQPVNSAQYHRESKSPSVHAKEHTSIKITPSQKRPNIPHPPTEAEPTQLKIRPNSVATGASGSQGSLAEQTYYSAPSRAVTSNKSNLPTNSIKKAPSITLSQTQIEGTPSPEVAKTPEEIFNDNIQRAVSQKIEQGGVGQKRPSKKVKSSPYTKKAVSSYEKEISNDLNMRMTRKITSKEFPSEDDGDFLSAPTSRVTSTMATAEQEIQSLPFDTPVVEEILEDKTPPVLVPRSFPTMKTSQEILSTPKASPVPRKPRENPYQPINKSTTIIDTTEPEPSVNKLLQESTQEKSSIENIKEEILSGITALNENAGGDRRMKKNASDVLLPVKMNAKPSNASLPTVPQSSIQSSRRGSILQSRRPSMLKTPDAIQFISGDENEKTEIGELYFYSNPNSIYEEAAALVPHEAIEMEDYDINEAISPRGLKPNGKIAIDGGKLNKSQDLKNPFALKKPQDRPAKKRQPNRPYFLAIMTLGQLIALCLSFYYSYENTGSLIQTSPFNYLIGPASGVRVS